MNITITVHSRIASVRDSPPPEIVCGNSDYVLLFDWDSEWDTFGTVTCCIICYTADGETRSEITVSDGAVSLPVLHDVYAVEVGLTAGDLYTTTPAHISCLSCITDGGSTERAEEFDVYNAMMEYLAGRQSGIHSEEELFEMYQELLDHNVPPEPEEFPSAAYRQAIAAPQRITNLTGTLTLTDGTVLDITERDIADASLGIRTDCMTDDVLLPGGVPSAEMTVTLIGTSEPEDLYGAELSLIYHLLLPSGLWYDVPLGTFTLEAVDSIADRHLSVTGYDDMQKLSHIPRSALSIIEESAYTAQEIIGICADAVGLEVEESGEFVNTDVKFVLSKADTRIETARDLLMYAVQVLGAVAYVDRFRKLRIKAISSADPTVTYSASQRKNLIVSQRQYKLFQLNAVYQYPDPDENLQIEKNAFYTLWSSGVTVDLPENPLFAVIDIGQQYHRGSIQRCITQLVHMLDPIVYMPFTAEAFDDPAIELLEYRSFMRSGESFSAPITSVDWQYRRAQTVQSCGAEAVAGILRDQAEKKALAVRISASQTADNFFRDLYLGLIRTTGHEGMAQRTHDWLAHYTHGELSGEENV